MQDVFLSIYSILENPNPEHYCGGNFECAEVYLKNKKEYERIAK